MMKYFLFLLISILSFAGETAMAQPSKFLFHHQGDLNENGINFVNDILFDSQKRVWLGGQTGFYRYDGQHYIPYRKTKDRNSIPDNFVHALCEDKQGNIWGGTEGGIFRFNPSIQKFKRYLTPDAHTNQGVRNICSDANGSLWATNANQLLYYNPQADSFELRYDVNVDKINETPNDIRKRGLLPSPDGQHLFLATRQGLWAYHIARNTMLNSATQPQNPFFTSINTSALAEGANGLFLFFDNSNKNIVQFDPVAMKVIKKISLAHVLPDAAGATLFEAKDGSIWFCSWSNQVLMVDPQQNNRIYDLNGKLNESLGLLSNYFWQVRQDDDGSIWLATPEGVFVCNEPKDLFKIHRLNTTVTELKSNVYIDVFVENPADHTWWMSTSGNPGIFFLPTNQKAVTQRKTTVPNTILHYNPVSGSYRAMDLTSAPPNPQGLKPSGINFICFYENNPVFITNNGAWLWQTATQQWQTFEAATGIQFPFTIRYMAGNGKKGYFISDGQQLACFNTTQKTLKTIVPAGGDDTLYKNYILYPRQSLKSGLYGSMGTSVLLRLHPDSAAVIPIVKNSRVEYIGYIDDIDIDSRGQVWVSFKNVGLFMYNPADGKLRQWDESDGLAVNGIHNLTIDQRDNIWTIHRRQFSVLLAGTNRFFNVAMPITNPILNWSNNLVTLVNGHIAANNFNDMFEFFPDRLLQLPVPRLPEISSLHINEKSRIFLTGKTLRLSPHENSLHFKFGMLTNKNYFPYDLQFMLQGAETNWQTAGANAEAFYNKLPPGRYTFKVRAVATNGSWTSNEQVLDLIIDKPLHQQIWFIVVMLLVIASLILAISRYRLHKQRQVLGLETKAAALEREKATIQYDSLKQQLNPHFLFNSLTSLEGLIEADQQMASSFLQRMSDMYRYILKNGDHETVPVADELKFAQLYVDIQQTRFENGLVMDVNVPEACLTARIAPVTLQNMIENAIKHNVVDENAPLIIRIYVDGDYLVVSNNLQKKNKVEASNKTGLAQFVTLYKFLSEKPVIIEENEKAFRVKIPLI